MSFLDAFFCIDPRKNTFFSFCFPNETWWSINGKWLHELIDKFFCSFVCGLILCVLAGYKLYSTSFEALGAHFLRAGELLAYKNFKSFCFVYFNLHSPVP